MLRFSWLLLLLVLSAGMPHTARSQPFETVEFRLSGMQNVRPSFVHEFWQYGMGGELAAETPFYLGFAEVGGAFHRYRAETPAVPAFSALMVYTGWGLGVEVASRIRLASGFRIGNYRMTFEEQTFSGVRNESELALGAQARLSVRPVGPVSVHAGVSYTKVYTFHRLKLWYVSAGLSYRLQSPDWLKAFLQ